MKPLSKTCFVVSLIMTFAASALMADVAWHDKSWLYRRRVTIPAANVSGDLSDFPVLLAVTALDMMRARTDGADFMVTGDDGITKLDREIENFDWNAGELALWFRVPLLSSGSDNVFFLYYGNPDGAETNSSGVWSRDYRMVQHMDQDPEDAPPQIIDSTTNSVDLTCQGSMVGTNVVAGKIGDALYFDGVANQLYRVDDGTLDPASSFSVSVWVKRENLYGNIIRKLQTRYNGYQGYFLGTARYSTFGNDAFVMGINGVNTPNYVDTAWFSTGTWHHVVGVVDRSTVPDSMRLYVDGLLVNSNLDVDATKDFLNGPDLYIARPLNNTTASRWKGGIDEVRIVFAGRTTEWVETEFANQNDPAAFMTLGHRETWLSGTVIFVR